MMSQMENLDLETTPSEPSKELKSESESAGPMENVVAESECTESPIEVVSQDPDACPSCSITSESSEVTSESEITAESSESDENRDRNKTKFKKSGVGQSQKEFEDFLASLNGLTDPDAKLKSAVDKMEVYLSQGSTPQFRFFWEIRKLCLEYFKENISPGVRAALWPKYSELSKEARRLKEMFDEQSAFAVEQINMAIDALESDLINFDDCMKKHEDIQFPFPSKYLEEKISGYGDYQKRLNLLNAHASRVNTLRKELIKVDMRVKQKNKFFQRLSEAGDKIFPLRKDLIKQVSECFIEDVNTFISTHFSEEQINDSVFFLREEIKSLQGMAKFLTLNTQSFTSTRLKLSECWDKLKGVDKERKKERAEKKELFKQNSEEIQTKIVEFSEKMNAGSLSPGAANRDLDEIQKHMRNVELGRDEVKTLRDEIGSLRSAITDKMKADEENRLQEEKEKLRLKKEKVEEVKILIDNFFAEAQNLTAEAIEKRREELQSLINEHRDISTKEKNDLERPLRNLNDLIDAKREEALLNLSEDDQEVLLNLREVLKQRRKRRKEIKENYDSLRKIAGSSGLDIEKAMLTNEQVKAERERLEHIDEGIAEMEQKISEIKMKIR